MGQCYYLESILLKKPHNNKQTQGLHQAHILILITPTQMQLSWTKLFLV